jgi:uncharacterized protein
VSFSPVVVSLPIGDQAGVDELVERVRRAGAEVVTEPGQQPWGYAGAFADPDRHLWMVTTTSATRASRDARSAPR